VLRAQTGPDSGRISLGFLPSLGLELIPRLIKEYRRKYRRVEFTLVQRAAQALMEQLEEGAIAKRRTLKLKELASETFLALTPGNTLNKIFEKAWGEAGFVPKIAFAGMDLGTLRGMVAAGLGIAVLPSSPVRLQALLRLS
jgi:DNA-binding transcriptional LysR family regulator